MTKKRRRLLATFFGLLAAAAIVIGVMGAVCDELSFDCIRTQGRVTARAAVVAAPLVAYVLYRLFRGRAPND